MKKRKDEEFINVQQAEDYKAKMEKIKRVLKIPFIVSAVSSAIVCGGVAFPNMTANMPEFIGNVFGFILLIALVAILLCWVFSIIVGGKMMLSLVGKILFCGFIFVPFPMSLFIGPLFAVLALLFSVFVPWVIIGIVWIRAKKAADEAEEYIYYASQSEQADC